VGHWDFTESDYDGLDRIALPSKAVDELIPILASSTTNGWKNRNHPTGHYRAILKFHYRDGRHCYLLYDAMYYQNAFYTSLRSLPAGTTNPNGGRFYENVPLAQFLSRYDPWWLSVPGEPEWYRNFRERWNDHN
jgi:hypothetical protein